MAEKNGIPEPGWSDRANDPEIAAAIAKNRKAAFKWGCVTVLIALVAPAGLSQRTVVPPKGVVCQSSDSAALA